MTSTTTTTTTGDDEQIVSSPFYQSLLDHIPNLERDAATYGWLICIPQHTALPPPHRLTLSMLQTHILKPVPDMPNTYVTMSGKRLQKIARLILKTMSPDFDHEVEFKILFDETFYLTETLCYKCLLLEKPLVGAPKALCFEDGSEIFKQGRSQEEWWSIFVRETPDVVTILNELDNLQQTIPHPVPLSSSAFVSLPTSSTAFSFDLVKQQSTRALQVLQTHVVFQVAWTEPRYLDILTEAVQSCACAAAHATIFSSLCQIHAFGEKDLQVRMHDLRTRLLKSTVQAHDGDDDVLQRLGLLSLSSSSTAMELAIHDLTKLNEPRCSLEKMWLIRDAVYRFRGNSASADEILPMLLKALCLAAPGLILANVSYVTDYLDLDKISELAYHRTMLHAVVSIIQEHTLSSTSVAGPFDFLKDLKVFGGSGMSHPAPTTTKVVTNSGDGDDDDTNSVMAFFRNLNCVPAKR